jgi:hypothetical protein
MTASNLNLHYEESSVIGARADLVFEYLDDFEALGSHMTRASWMMAGSRMRYEFDEARGRRVGATVGLRGSFLGLSIYIDERVTQRTPPLGKAWETIGRPRMLILAQYQMGFALVPVAVGSRVTVFIDYAVAEHGVAHWLGRVAGGFYARWCVRSMIRQAAGKFGRATDAVVGAT